MPPLGQAAASPWPVFAVPFNLFGAVENMSRNWVVDKIAIGVTYDSDRKEARKLIADRAGAR